MAVASKRQQADTGTKMIHLGKNTKSTILSKGISAGHGQNTYRGLVKIAAGATGARNFSQCDSLLIGELSGAHTVPTIEVHEPTARMEHEATTSRIGEEQLFYCRSRGLNQEDAVSLIVSGFCKQVLSELPMEFAVEARKLLEVSLEGAVGLGSRVKRSCSASKACASRSAARKSCTASISRSARASCTRSWGRTHRARARSRTSSPVGRATW